MRFSVLALASLVLSGCAATGPRAARLAEPSGLEHVRLLSKGLE